MARRSKGEHLKTPIFERLAEGASAMDIRNEFPEVPVSTVYVWVKEYKLTGQIPPEIDVIPEPLESEPEPDPKSVINLVRFPRRPPENLELNLKEDLYLIRRVLKAITESADASPAVKIQGCSAWMRLLELHHTGRIEASDDSDFMVDLTGDDSEELIAAYQNLKNAG